MKFWCLCGTPYLHSSSDFLLKCMQWNLCIVFTVNSSLLFILNWYHWYIPVVLILCETTYRSNHKVGHVSNGCHRTWTDDCTNCFIRVTLHITSGILSMMVAMEPAFLGSLYRQVVVLSRSLCTVSGPVQLGPGAVIIVKR